MQPDAARATSLLPSMNPAHFFRSLLMIGMFVAGACVTSAQTVGELIEKGDKFDLKMQAVPALEFYLPAEKLDPNDAELLLRIARQYRHLLADTADKKEKVRLGRISLAYAERAAALAPNNAEAQLSPAISYGKMLPFMSSGDQVNASPRIKAAVDRTLRLDPNNDNAWHILGRWNRTLAEIGGIKRALAGAIYGSLPKGTYAAAEQALKKAIALNPNRLIHYIELGRIYAQMGRTDDQRRMLQKGLSMPSLERDDAEMKAIGRELLKKLK